MTLPLHTRLLMVAETLDQITQLEGFAPVGMRTAIEQEAQVLIDMATELSPHPNGGMYVCRECRAQLGASHKLDCSRG